VNASPTALLTRLADGGVDFVVIGGVAVVVHVHIRTTRDLDITYSTAPENLEALGEVLVDLDARLRGVAEVVPFVPDGRALRHAGLLTLEASLGSLDLLAEPPGAPPYDELAERALRIALDGREVRVASIPDLLAMKRAAARPRDVEDIEALEAIARLNAEDGSIGHMA
jgi:hypothetical protein